MLDRPNFYGDCGTKARTRAVITPAAACAWLKNLNRIFIFLLGKCKRRREKESAADEQPRRYRLGGEGHRTSHIFRREAKPQKGRRIARWWCLSHRDPCVWTR